MMLAVVGGAVVALSAPFSFGVVIIVRRGSQNSNGCMRIGKYEVRDRSDIISGFLNNKVYR